MSTAWFDGWRSASCASAERPLQLWLQVRCSLADKLSAFIVVPRDIEVARVTLPVYNIIPEGRPFRVMHNGGTTQLIGASVLPKGIRSVRLGTDHASRRVVFVAVAPGSSHTLSLEASLEDDS